MKLQKTKKPSLDEYIATQHVAKLRGGATCRVCELPERAQVDKALRDGKRVIFIVQYLRDVCGHAHIGRSHIDYHRRDHVKGV